MSSPDELLIISQLRKLVNIHHDCPFNILCQKYVKIGKKIIILSVSNIKDYNKIHNNKNIDHDSKLYITNYIRLTNYIRFITFMSSKRYLLTNIQINKIT